MKPCAGIARPGAAVVACVLVLSACKGPPPFDPETLAEGPGGMVGNNEPLRGLDFPGGSDVIPAARSGVPVPDDTRPPDCDAACKAYCDAAGLQNPLHRGLCPSLWGVGLASQPIDAWAACRKLHVDLIGRLPSPEEASATCTGDWAETVRQLMSTPDFVALNQRRAADTFLYSTQTVGLPRIYDMDRLVKKLYEGRIPYDLFAAVASAHPILTRRYAAPGDTAEALFRIFLGRPPFEAERADMGRLYALWDDGYVDHPVLHLRLPDAFMRFRCLTPEGAVDEVRKGECTSLLWGYQELIFTPDLRASLHPDDRQPVLWSGLLRPEEWERLQIPGRVLARDPAFWEKAVSDVVIQYLGYDLTKEVPEVRQELVKYLLDAGGDIRSVHFAVATSMAYLQSPDGTSQVKYPWTYGPLKQMEAEVWLDSLAQRASKDIASCDHRISAPDELVQSRSLSAYRTVQSSRWRIDPATGLVDHSYSSMARTLGGCPENVVGGRFKVISLLTTSTQFGFVNEICNVGEDPAIRGSPVELLLPDGLDASSALDADDAARITQHQYGLFLGRAPVAAEVDEAMAAAAECSLATCTASQFARPLCFALLSSPDLLFY